MKLTDLRKVDKLYEKDHNKRTLFESVVVPEITTALRDWSRANPGGVLIGGLALSYWAQPRYTMDIDVLFGSEQELPEQVSGFKKLRGHSFQHNKTHVEIEVLTPEFLKIPSELWDKVLQTSVERNGVRIASPTGIAALKLWRGSVKDLGDIESLLDNNEIDLTHWPFPEDKIERAESVLGQSLRR